MHRHLFASPRTIGLLGSIFAALQLACSAASPPVAATDAGSSGGPTLDASANASLGLNDVSVLIPLPPTLDAAGYLTPETAGRGGALLPEEVFRRIPSFTPAVAGFERGKLRALAIRFDGCFRKDVSQACEAQIRVVMQPVSAATAGGGGAGAEANDAAVHLFYRIADADFANVVRELRKLRSLAPEADLAAPLQVHPSLKAQGIEGPYGKALLALVRGYAGAETLSRVTFFLRTPSRSDEWDFGGLTKSGGEWNALAIPGVGEKQRVLRPTSLAPDYEYRASPVATAPEDLTVALSSTQMASATKEAREAAIGALTRVENPTKHSADQIQCVACHVSSVIGSLAATQYQLSLADFKDTYTSKSGRNLAMTAAPGGSSLSVLRAFGWFGPTPAISRRVVHESAEVVDDLELRFPKPGG